MGCLVVFSACNQQEFYEKQFLEGVGVADDRLPDVDITDPSDITNPDEGVVITEPDNGSGDGDGGVVIVTPPTTNPTDPGDIADGGNNGGGDVTDPATPTDPTSPTDPVDPGDIADGGDNGGGDVTDPATPTDPTSPTDPVDPGDIADGGDNGGGDVTDPATPTDPTSPTDPVDPGDIADGGDNGGGDVTDPATPTDPTSPTDPVDPGDIADGGDNGGGDQGGDNDDGEVVVVPTPEPTPEVILIDKVEKFVQNKAKDAPVDILWVIDDSGSMGDEQRSLAYNFDVFINEFLEKKIDFQMAITTTDPTSRGDGKWKINPKMLTAQAAAKNEKKFLNDFKRTVQVGTKGSGSEMGLHTANRFLERYEGSVAHQWLRDDAYLIVVILSDEEEQAKASVESLVSNYQSYKKNGGMVKVYTIVTTDLRGQQWETIGERYMKAATMTNGVIADIHQDFYTVLRDMGAKIVDLLDKFALAATPHQGVAVKVNGQLVETGYVYNSETKTVKFLDGHVPAEGSAIEVHYQVEQTNQTLLASGSN